MYFVSRQRVNCQSACQTCRIHGLYLSSPPFMLSLGRRQHQLLTTT